MLIPIIKGKKAAQTGPMLKIKIILKPHLFDDLNHLRKWNKYANK